MYLSAWLHMYVPLYLNVEIWYTSFQPFLVHTVSYETLFFPLWVMTLLLHAWDEDPSRKSLIGSLQPHQSQTQSVWGSFFFLMLTFEQLFYFHPPDKNCYFLMCMCMCKFRIVFLHITPLTPKSVQHLISPYNITSESHIKVDRIKEMITSWRNSSLMILDIWNSYICTAVKKQNGETLAAKNTAETSLIFNCLFQ